MIVIFFKPIRRKGSFIMKTTGILSILICTLVIASCCCIRTSPNMKLSQKDSGTVVKASKGQMIEIALKGNPTTGYTWNIGEYDKKILKLEGSSFVRDSDLTGAGGIETVKFSVIKKGKTNLTIQYNRVWEKDIKPIEVFSLTIVPD